MPAPLPVDQTPADLADEPDGRAVEAAQQIGPGDNPRSPQTDIERADEHKPGSIETVPGEAPEDHSAAFIEPIGEDHDDLAQEPPARDG
jgi:hypothetical protein